MNLHLAHESKFIGYFIEYANQLNVENKYIIYHFDKDRPRLFEGNNIVFVSLYSEEFWKVIGNFDQYKSIYIHYLNERLFRFIETVPKQKKLIWIFWGGDAFSLPKFEKWQFEEENYQFLKKHNLVDLYPLQVSFNPIRTYYSVKNHYKYAKKITRYEKIMQRFDFFAHYIKYDYDLIKKNYKLKAKFIDFQYCSGLEEIKLVNQPYNHKNNILLGNSAAATNNHISLIKKLASIPIGERKIYCPLSYSGYPQYVEHIVELGKEYLGNNFIPLLKEIEVFEYNKLIDSCAILLMNHKRSQAGSNIYAALYSGAKIYMNKDSTLFKLLKERGFHLYTIDDFFLKQLPDLDTLTIEEIKNNRALLDRYENEEVLMDKFRNLLEI